MFPLEWLFESGLDEIPLAFTGREDPEKALSDQDPIEMTWSLPGDFQSLIEYARNDWDTAIGHLDEPSLPSDIWATSAMIDTRGDRGGNRSGDSAEDIAPVGLEDITRLSPYHQIDVPESEPGLISQPFGTRTDRSDGKTRRLRSQDAYDQTVWCMSLTEQESRRGGHMSLDGMSSPQTNRVDSLETVGGRSAALETFQPNPRRRGSESHRGELLRLQLSADAPPGSVCRAGVRGAGRSESPQRGFPIANSFSAWSNQIDPVSCYGPASDEGDQLEKAWRTTSSEPLLPPAPEEVHLMAEISRPGVRGRKRGRPRKHERERIAMSAFIDPFMSSSAGFNTIMKHESANSAPRISRSRPKVPRSDPHVRLSSSSSQRSRSPRTIGKGMNGGRNLLALFDYENEPRTRYVLMVERGRKGREANNAYPASTDALPLGLTLDEVCQRYPNHVWGTMLRVFESEGWEAEKIWSALPEDCRHDTSKVRPWNYLQQAMGRETDKMVHEETGQRRVPLRRKKESEDEGDEEGREDQKVRRITTIRAPSNEAAASPVMRCSFQPPRPIRYYSHSFKRVPEETRPTEFRKMVPPMGADGTIFGQRLISPRPTPTLSSMSPHIPSSAFRRERSRECGLAAPAKAPSKGAVSELKHICQLEKRKQVQTISQLLNIMDPQFRALPLMERAHRVDQDWHTRINQWQQQLMRQYGLDDSDHPTEFHRDPIRLLKTILISRKPHPSSAEEAQLWNVELEFESWRCLAASLQHLTREWYGTLTILDPARAWLPPYEQTWGSTEAERRPMTDEHAADIQGATILHMTDADSPMRNQSHDTRQDSGSMTEGAGRPHSLHPSISSKSRFRRRWSPLVSPQMPEQSSEDLPFTGTLRSVAEIKSSDIRRAADSSP